MKELFSVLSTGVMTPLVTLIAPGVFAITPWVSAMLLKAEKPVRLFESYRLEATFAFLFAALLTGLITDTLGASIETAVLDTRVSKQKEFEEHEQEWFSYLRLAFRVEPVGHRYLRRLVLHLKFELNSGVGLLIGAFGYLFIPQLECWRIVLPLLSIGLSCWLLYESRNSHKALSRLRREMLKEIKVIG